METSGEREGEQEKEHGTPADPFTPCKLVARSLTDPAHPASFANTVVPRFRAASPPRRTEDSCPA